MEDMNKRNQEPEENGETSKSKNTQFEKFQCKECGQNFNRAIVNLVGIDFSRNYCDKCVADYERKEKEQEEIFRRQGVSETRRRWLDNSGMTQELKTKTFENFDGNRVLLKSVYKWAKAFNLEEAHGIQSLIFYSDKPGMGKTHLMAAIANYIIDNWDGDPEFGWRQPIRFESGPGLVRRIRATYNIVPGSNHEREEDVYNNLMGVRLLLLDDVGKERPSDFTRETYWYIIDERLKSNLPVVISTRLQLNNMEGLMGEDTVDRLYGMARGKILELTGSSYRRRNLQP